VTLLTYRRYINIFIYLSIYLKKTDGQTEQPEKQLCSFILSCKSGQADKNTCKMITNSRKTDNADNCKTIVAL